MAGVEALLAAYMVAFAFVHSYTASRGFKKKIEARMEPQVYRFAYTIVSALTALPIVWIWLYYGKGAPVVYSVPFPFRWISFVLMLLGAGLALVSLLQTDPLAFIGVKAVLRLDSGGDKGLNKSGTYSLVRHPLYLGGMLLLWGNPVMTTVALTGSTFATAYFIVGGRLEEQKLIEEFGDEYREYMKEVSGFIPIKWIKNRIG